MHVGFPVIHASPPAILERLSLSCGPGHHSTEVAFANAELQYQGFRA